MALLGFKNRFASRILDGSKRQTIRKKRKHPIVAGETLHLYTGLRTKNAKKLATPLAKEVWWVVIEYNRPVSAIRVYTHQGGVLVDKLESHKELNEFARLDGFDSWDDMRDFWIQEHGGSIFRGTLIEW